MAGEAERKPRSWIPGGVIPPGPTIPGLPQRPKKSSAAGFPLPDTGVSSAAKAAAQAWQAAMCCNKQPCTMPPWEENTYFDTPQLTPFNLAANTDTIVASANPQRIAIIMQNTTPIGVSSQIFINFGTVVGPTPAAGISLLNTTLPLQLKQEDYPGLVSQEIHALTSGGASGLVVIEVIINRWPSPNDIRKSRNGNQQTYTPPTDTVPGQNGGTDTTVASTPVGLPADEGSPTDGYPTVGGVPIVTQPLSHDYDSGGSGTSTPDGWAIIPET